MAQSFRQIVGAAPSTASSSSKETALIIIDAQNEYAHGLLKVVSPEQKMGGIAGLLEKFRAQKDGSERVIHVLHEVPDGAPVFTPGKDVSREYEDVKAKDGEKVIMKHHPGSFAETDLHETLQKRGIKQVVLTGFMAHVCVSTTARQAAELGYDVILPEDAIGDRDIPGLSGEEVTKAALLELGDAFGTVVKGSDIK
ncbi:MAG: hypothetical protein MMC33_008290 [Icmadophila ericetorum]|nr:hypothetical protein [Icmadophila ericetorum]